MTRERIEDFKEVLLPFVKKWLLRINYENRGKSDAEEFEKDFNEILDLAIKALEQEPCEDTVSRDDVVRIVQHNNTVKALEKIRALPSVTPQEPILDKIRAEIERIEISGQIDEHSAFIRSGEHIKTMVLDIINKYKAETEAENA